MPIPSKGPDVSLGKEDFSFSSGFDGKSQTSTAARRATCEASEEEIKCKVATTSEVVLQLSPCR